MQKTAMNILIAVRTSQVALGVCNLSKKWLTTVIDLLPFVTKIKHHHHHHFVD
jgi:hypothetical protein